MREIFSGTYVRQWSRISAAHEFGQVLGLMDEYYGAKSDAVVKKMISDGLLPPGTRGDHLAANPPANNVGEAGGKRPRCSCSKPPTWRRPTSRSRTTPSRRA